MENAAAAIEKANGRIDLLPLTINRTFNDFCRDCQADSSGAWRRQDVLRGGLPHLAKQRELFLLCPYEAVEVPLCVFQKSHNRQLLLWRGVDHRNTEELLRVEAHS